MHILPLVLINLRRHRWRAAIGAAGALFLVAKPFTPESFKEALSPVLG